MHGNRFKFKIAKLEPHEMIDNPTLGKQGAKADKIFALRGEAVLGENPVANNGRGG